MANDAHVSLQGTLIGEPKSNQINNSTVVSFGVSVSTTKKKENSKYYDTDIYNVSVWGKPGEYLLDKLQKGTVVWVTGEMNMRTFKDRNGEEHTTPNVKANSVKAIDKVKGATSKSSTKQNSSAAEEPVSSEDPF